MAETWTWQLVEYGANHTPRIIVNRGTLGKRAIRECYDLVKLHDSWTKSPFTLVDSNEKPVHRVWTPSRKVLHEVARWESERLPKMTTSGVTWRGTCRCVTAWLRREIEHRKKSPLCGDTWRHYERDLIAFRRYTALLKEARDGE